LVLVFSLLSLPVCLFMDGWVVVMSMHTLTHDRDVSLFIRCEYDILCLVKTGEEICGSLWLVVDSWWCWCWCWMVENWSGEDCMLYCYDSHSH